MRILHTVILLLLVSATFAQFKEPKFGKIDMADMTMTRYEKDTTAAALILFDNGDTDFRLNNDNRFLFVFERHCRIKIFKKSAFELGDVSILLHISGVDKEILTDLDAATFNLVDGKIVKSKLENSKVYADESKYAVEKKFAFPDVKEGSIIEYSYRVTSLFLYEFRAWTFQKNYPALWSQYHFTIPEYLTYRQNTKGYLPFDVNVIKQDNVNYKVHWVETLSPGQVSNNTRSGQPLSEYYDITAGTTETTLAVKDVPAFISEPNIDCEENYLQSIDFELSSVQYPHQMRKDYTRTWEAVNKEMNKEEDFGLLLGSTGFISDTVEVLCANKGTDLEKAMAIYSYVQNHMSWNGSSRVFASDGLKKPFLKRSGTSVEINLLLTIMLQEAKLKANPVLFSTRSNGIAMSYFPTIAKYNSVLSKVDIDGKSYLLDATSKYCPFGVLPANDINGQGRVVNAESGDWADLTTLEKSRTVKSYDLAISADGIFSGNVAESYAGYAAIKLRNILGKEKSNDDYIRKLQESETGLTISSYSIKDQLNIYKSVTDTLKFELANRAEVIGDKIIFNPLLLETMDKNHYTLEERKYPIDYNHPILETFVFSYTLPQGYVVESMPQSISMKLPDGSMSVSYSLQAIDNKIKISYKRVISKVMYVPEEYDDLKEFYNQIVKKHAEQIILKKAI